MSHQIKVGDITITGICTDYANHPLYKGSGGTKTKTLIQAKVDRLVIKKRRRGLNGLVAVWDYSKI